VLAVGVDLDVCAAFDEHLDRFALIPGASVYPFVWGILLAARNEGYDGVLITMAVAEEPRVKELLSRHGDIAWLRRAHEVGRADAMTAVLLQPSFCSRHPSHY
jgi:hypothetical protein